jgi:hypothetical protein
MKRVWLLLAALGVSVLTSTAWVIVTRHDVTVPTLVQHVAIATPSAADTSPPAPSASPQAVNSPQPPPGDLPVLLRITRIGVNAVVERVGVTATGAMDVPKQWDDVGWFSPGPLPGGPGDAVIDGHLDSTTGPAVFIHLAEVRLGDRIVVVFASGASRTFQVDRSTRVAAGSTAWSEGVFSHGPPGLILITCSGLWDRSQRQYNERLVLDATLVPDSATPATA